MSEARATPTDLEKAIASAERVGLQDYDVVKEGRKITIRVRHSQTPSEHLDLDENMKRAVGL
jgi:hypothetical protein